MIVYVSRTCGACQKFLQLLVAYPKLLAVTDVRIIDGNPQNLLAMHELGAQLTPTLVVFGPNGERNVFQGPQAAQKLVTMA